MAGRNDNSQGEGDTREKKVNQLEAGKRANMGEREGGYATYPRCRVACEGAPRERRGRAGNHPYRAPGLFDSNVCVRVHVSARVCVCVLVGSGE